MHLEKLRAKQKKTEKQSSTFFKGFRKKKKQEK